MLAKEEGVEKEEREAADKILHDSVWIGTVVGTSLAQKCQTISVYHMREGEPPPWSANPFLGTHLRKLCLDGVNSRMISRKEESVLITTSLTLAGGDGN